MMLLDLLSNAAPRCSRCGGPNKWPSEKHRICRPCINAGVRAVKARDPEKVKEQHRAYRANNLSAVRARCAEWARQNRESSRVRSRRHRYGVTRAKLDEMFEAQGGLCAICSTVLVDSGIRCANAMHVDHDHATTEIRGLLCKSCNNGLGFFKDDPERLRSAAAYLETNWKGTKS